MTGTTRNWARSIVNWNIALDSDGGPRNGGCGTCTGLVTRLPDGSVRKDAEYYTIEVRPAGRSPDREYVVRDDRGGTGS